MTKTRQLTQAQEAWSDSNPFRAWRIKSGIRQHIAANILNVTTTTLRQWERGYYQPSTKHLKNIAAYAGGGVVQKWAEWYQARPGAKG